ncbi:hypothetical protein D8B26_005030 [Coccidioides posadasii str. Silveira]|uniref:Uncharacterized protein n=3 Tax=Coccidioides posadasii TaxID=199306 RepID=E9D5J7_COCPS|nr:Major Facilitator Superfamily protein [Coccidioides posadasii C735 delta SOWgp]EER24620.1 Major Facilitator Superfamily protein [Coccidioides posadasii C735 delta SOWgp]EFW18191.1 conserved hypothetical protein [Coccidioides posadasii str. Silveira]KMM66417.1 hypothetical protein CPAG_02756 [Coccidioides posadasii RMSCC 3488]QVM10369.1 hypothetical protein D8B26_005030 [Coccidioides posadasii str. Silveira]|eukprot:XP_003066765.1 Major Facilitator Superfamily protein [Coccidioides posadasii C735 delta SOWgp]
MGHTEERASPIPGSVEDSRADGSSGSTVNHIDPTKEKPAETAEPGAALQNSDEESDKKIDPGKEKASVNNVSSVPNGGTRAWLQVLGAHFLFFNSWGIVNTFGSYETYYEIDLLSTSSPSSIAWVGSLQAFLLLFVGALTGPVYDAGYSRELIIGGSFFLIFGQMMLSLCSEYWQVLLAQGFCIGIGCGLLCVPSTAILSQYFTTKLATAVGFTASGSSFGGIIYPIVFHRLQPKIGFPWATRVLGFIMLSTQLVSIVVMRVRVVPDKKRAILDLAAFKELPYFFFVFSVFVGFMGLYQPFFYVQTFAIQNSITNSNLGFYILAIMNSTSAFGRIIPGILSDKIGPMNVMLPCAFVSSLLCFCIIPVKNAAGLIVLMALYGFFSGTFVSSPTSIVVHLSTHSRGKIGTRLGQCFGVVSFGLLIGTPVGGVVYKQHGFSSLWILAGVLIAASGAILLTSRKFYKGLSLMIKA